jgi:hypothetical protein
MNTAIASAEDSTAIKLVEAEMDAASLRANGVLQAVSRGELPGNAAALVGPSRRPQFFEWSAAAVDPGHWLYERWRRHHLALIMALPAVAGQIADDDPRKKTTAELVQAAAAELLRRRLSDPAPSPRQHPRKRLRLR